MDGLGTRGATRQSWQREISIRVFIKEIQDANPKATDSKLVQLLADRMRDDDDALIAAAQYAVTNALNEQRGYSRHRRQPTPEERAAREAEINAQAKEAAQQILLLNMEMPNGKRLRYCTGTYIAKLGGGLAKAGKKAGGKLMGEVFSEKTLREYME